MLADTAIATVKTVLEVLPFGVLLLDDEHKVTYSNPKAESFLHRSSDSLIEEWADVCQLGLLSEDRLTDGPNMNEVTLRGRVLSISYHPLSSAKGPPTRANQSAANIHALVTMRDINETTDLKQQNSALRESMRDLEAMFDSSYDEIFVTDGDGNTLRVNSACERLYGVPASQIVGKNVRELERNGIFSPSITPLVLRTRERTTVVQETKSGRKVVATANPVFNEEGDIVRIVTNSRDITDFHTLKTRLSETEDLVKRYLDEVQTLRQEHTRVDNFVANSKAMQAVVEIARRVARFDSTVLLQGESGTGKDSLAKLIHTFSARGSGPFMKVNCGAIPETLLESDFFGYVPGAFTGAQKGGKAGVIEMANKGTLFLNEIDAMPLHLQVKLLHVIQEKQFMRVGGTREVKVDIRVIAASNKDLSALVAQGQFREDLFYRLNVIPVMIPPLRDRVEDIPLLINHFLQQTCSKYAVAKRISPQAIDLLASHRWPGNVRELENIIERAVVTSAGPIIRPIDLPENIRKAHASNGKATPFAGRSSVHPLDSLDEIEKVLIIQAFQEGGSTRKAAALLGVSQSTVVRKMQKYGIDPGHPH